MEQKSIKSIAKNKKAGHDYFIDDSYEAGIELFGTEVKSIRAGQVNLKDSWCDIKNGNVMATRKMLMIFHHHTIGRTNRLLIMMKH